MYSAKDFALNCPLRVSEDYSNQSPSVRACVCACVCACVRACMCACVHGWVVWRRGSSTILLSLC